MSLSIRRNRRALIEACEPRQLLAVFTAGQPIATGPGHAVQAVADVTGDGRLDLINTGFLNGQLGLIVRPGLGNNSFGTPTRVVATTTSASAILIGDVNRDSRNDVVLIGGPIISSTQPGRMEVLLGKAGGGFNAPLLSGLPNGGASASSLGDIDGDGKPDLVIAGSGPKYVVFKGNGAGGFTAGASYTAPTVVYSTVLRDFNGDGRADIAVAATGSGAADGSVLIARLGTAQATFGAESSTAVPGRFSSTSELQVADMTGDAKPDLVASTYTVNASFGNVAGFANVFRNNGNGTFVAPTSTNVQLAGDAGLVVADVTGDAKPDVIVGRETTLAVLQGTGSTSLGARTTQTVTKNITEFFTGDFDGNGKVDLVAQHYFSAYDVNLDEYVTTASIQFYRNQSGGTVVSPPAAPSALVATANSASQITLNWNDNSADELGFKIERSTSAIGPWTFVTTTAANVKTFASTGLSANTTYYFRVRATNAGGDSANTGVASAKTLPAATAAPAAPSLLAGTATSSSQVKLTWKDNATNETAYRLQRATNSTFTAGLTTTSLAANAVGTLVASLAANTTYYFRLYALNGSASSGASSTISVKTLPAGTPAAPTGLTATVISKSQINLKWTDVGTSETGYRIQRSLASGGPWTTIATLGANATAYSSTGLAANTTYYYRVVAILNTTASAPSNTATAKTKAA